MKKLLPFLLALQSFGALAADPDFVKGVDFTGLTSITATKLNQLVDNGYVGGNRGMVIATNVAPDVTEAKLKRYLWLDTSSVPPLLKQYNTNGTPGWAQVAATATIAANSVVAGALQTGAVTTTNLVDGSVTTAKISDLTVTGAKIAAGTITTTNIAANTITSANILTQGISSASIALGAITGDKIATGSVGLTLLTNGFALPGTNIALNTIGSSNITAGGISLTNLATNSAAANSSLIYSGGQLTYDYPVVYYSTNAVMPTVASGSTTNLAGANTFPHGLGGIPTHVVVRLVNRANTGSAGYSVGDEISLDGIGVNGGGQTAVWAIYSDASKVDVFFAPLSNISLIKKDHTSVIAQTTAQFLADWTFKVVAVRFKY